MYHYKILNYLQEFFTWMANGNSIFFIIFPSSMGDGSLYQNSIPWEQNEISLQTVDNQHFQLMWTKQS